MSEFDYFNFQDVDPTFKPIPKGMRQLRLTKFAAIPCQPKSGKMEGKDTYRLPATFVIVNDPDFSGRRLTQTFWVHNVVDQKNIRRLADGVGIAQDAGEAVTDYARRIAEAQPEFRVFVDESVDKDQSGTEVPVNKISWSTIQPA